VPFAALQWLRLTRPVEASRSAEMFRQHGVRVESLPQRSSFSLTFANGQVLSGALYAYGAAFGGLGLYLAEGMAGPRACSCRSAPSTASASASGSESRC